MREGERGEREVDVGEGERVVTKYYDHGCLIINDTHLMNVISDWDRKVQILE